MTMATPTTSAAPWRQFVDPRGLRLSPDWQARLDAGERILFGGRSSSSGSKGRDLAARDVLAAAEQFAEQTGLDFRPVLPSLEEITLRLANCHSQSFDGGDGQRFSCRFLLIDLIAEAQIALLVATSSGAKITTDDDQPFVKRAAQEYKRVGATIFSVKELDRGARQDWALAPLIMAIQANGGALSDENGFGPIDDGRSMIAFVQGTSAKKMAVGMPKRTRREQRNRTGTEMVGGQVAYHLSSPPPPGFGVCWLRGAATNPTERVLYLDTQTCRPAESAVASGLGSVRYPDGHPSAGQLVDQVANVRFVLAHLGRPGYTKRSIVRELANRYYSTVMLRGNHSPSAIVTHDHGAEVLDAVIDNLAVYEFGVLHRNVGSGIEPLAISGCAPPDGPWAGPEDFARIRAYLKETDASTAQEVYLTFSGLRVTYNGSPAVLLSGKRTGTGRQRDETPRYRFAQADIYPHKVRAVADSRMVSAQAFAESIVQGILAVDGLSLEAFDPERFGEPRDSKLDQLRAQRTNMVASLDAIAKRTAALEQRLFEMGEDGELVLRGALLAKVQEDYNHIVEQEQPELANRLRLVEHEVAEREALLPRSTPANQLLHLVASLRDPTDRSYRGQWLASLRQVAFTSSLTSVDGLQVRNVNWEGLVVLEARGDEFAIPFAGAYEYGVGLRNREMARGLVERVLDALRSGLPISAAVTTQPTLVIPHVAAALGVPTSHMVLNGCQDPRVVRIAVAFLESPDRSDTDVALTLSESEALVSRIRTVHGGESALRSWIKSPDPIHAAFYAVAAANGGKVTAEQVLRLVPSTSLGQIYNVAGELRRSSSRWSTQRKKGYVLAPCACGSVAADLLKIPEPVGAVCLDCRADESGLVWSAEPYDQYCSRIL